MPAIPSLVAVIELLLAYHPKAIRILLGEHEPTLMELAKVISAASEHDEEAPQQSGEPQSRQLADMVKGEGIQRIVDEVGGWKQLAEAVLYYRDAFPSTWGMFADHVLSIIPGGASRLEEESQLQRIADQYLVTPPTVIARRKSVPYAIARYAEMFPPGELRRMMSGTYVTATEIDDEEQKSYAAMQKEQQRLLPL